MVERPCIRPTRQFLAERVSQECAEQAAAAKRHIEKVTAKLQYLCCDTCGNMVASRDKACCDKRTPCMLRTTFRIAGAAIESVFADEWVSASEEDGLQWLALYEGSTKDQNGDSVLCLCCCSALATPVRWRSKWRTC